jgi:hypothetical protein
VSLDVEFLNWFAGMLDGEGFFFVQFYQHKNGALPLTLRVEITLRDDDLAVLEHIQQKTGFGQIYRRKARTATSCPQATWRVHKQECLPFLELLEKVPLRSKKRRDYEIWKKAALEFAQFQRGGQGARTANQPHIDRIYELIAELQDTRAYASKT